MKKLGPRLRGDERSYGHAVEKRRHCFEALRRGTMGGAEAFDTLALIIGAQACYGLRPTLSPAARTALRTH